MTRSNINESEDATSLKSAITSEETGGKTSIRCHILDCTKLNSERSQMESHAIGCKQSFPKEQQIRILGLLSAERQNEMTVFNQLTAGTAIQPPHLKP